MNDQEHRMLLLGFEVAWAQKHGLSTIFKTYEVLSDISNTLIIKVTKLIPWRCQVELLEQIDLEIVRIEQLLHSLAFVEDIFDTKAINLWGL